ncbi:ERF family protein [Novosphingobium sp. HII-3]|uniref:ERF family protein n=1 Tax=Novosphingobium sp. HII-3 TaxID=2075565 RepID=UPI000CDA62B4|nr:ERF family protein [Novosphingobium sp. HII-3]
MNAQTRIAVPQGVYAKIAAVQAEIAKEGISKDRSNQQQKYKFRGIDDVYNALAPILARHGLCVLPRILSRDVVERKTNSGGTLFYVTVEAEFDFVSADDGSTHVVRTYGEAMDSGDKATNKAMSAAYKYAAFMAFAIPTEGDNDADATTHQVAPKQADAGPVISDAQYTKLQQLIPAAKITAAQFNQRYRCKTVADLPASRFAEAEEALNERIAELAKVESNQEAAHA